MILPGYCQECRNFRRVNATNAAIVKSQMSGDSIIGRCQVCESRAPNAIDKPTRRAGAPIPITTRVK